MCPALYVCVSILSFVIANRYIYDFEAKSRSSKKQVKISERIGLPKIRSVCRYRFIMTSAQSLRPAERILYTLPQQPCKCLSEELVTDEVEELHRFLLHWIDQSHAIYELSDSREPRFIESR